MTTWEDWPKDSDYFEREDRVIVVSMMITDQPQSIGEFACGTGIIPTMLRNYGYKGIYTGSDITQSALTSAREHNPNEKFEYADLNKPLPYKDKEFDITCIFTGLGYCNDIEKTLSELKRVTKRYLYIDQYNLFAPENNLRFLKGELVGNQYNKKWFDELLDRTGFDNLFEVEVTNIKDYEARPGIPTSKVNHIYKLGV